MVANVAQYEGITKEDVWDHFVEVTVANPRDITLKNCVTVFGAEVPY